MAKFYRVRSARNGRWLTDTGGWSDDRTKAAVLSDKRAAELRAWNFPTAYVDERQDNKAMGHILLALSLSASLTSFGMMVEEVPGGIWFAISAVALWAVGAIALRRSL